MTLANFTTEQLQAEIRMRMGYGLLSSRAIAAGNVAVAEACERFGIDPELILGRERSATVAQARIHAMAAMHAAGFSYQQCGRFFSRDHTTIIHAVKQARARTADF